MEGFILRMQDAMADLVVMLLLVSVATVGLLEWLKKVIERVHNGPGKTGERPKARWNRGSIPVYLMPVLAALNFLMAVGFLPGFAVLLILAVIQLAYPVLVQAPKAFIQGLTSRGQGNGQ